MSKRKPLDKAQLRERRNKLLEAAAAAELSLTEGVREMRTISGMTQEEFARHRGVSARVIKALELGQGNPTVATMNRIGEFFGLEVGFVPARANVRSVDQPQPPEDAVATEFADIDALRRNATVSSMEARTQLDDSIRKLNERMAKIALQLDNVAQLRAELNAIVHSQVASGLVKRGPPKETSEGVTAARTKRKPRSS